MKKSYDSEKLVKAGKIEQQLANVIEFPAFSIFETFDKAEMLAMMMSKTCLHDSNKIMSKALYDGGIPHEYISEYTNPKAKEQYWKFSTAVYNLAHTGRAQYSEDTQKAAKEGKFSLDDVAYSEKAKRLREIACIFADLADAFDICERWANESHEITKDD